MKKIVSCSFCEKGIGEVIKIIAGPNVYICDECVRICVRILFEELEKEFKHMRIKYKDYKYMWE